MQQQLKPDYEMQAQIASFATERIKNHNDQEHLLNNVAFLALGQVVDVVRVTERTEFRTDHEAPKKRITKVEAGTELTAALGSEYVDYLREVGGRGYEPISSRANILRAYDSFSPVVDSLQTDIGELKDAKSHPQFLGSGASSDVFKVERDGTAYAVRIPRGDTAKPTDIDSHLGGAVLAKGMAHMEQIVAASYESGVTLAELMPGREVDDLPLEDIASITNEQLGQLIDTVLDANERGIEIDPRSSNIFYDQEHGFGIVDYHSSKNVSKNSADQTPKDAVLYIPTILSSVGFNLDAEQFNSRNLTEGFFTRRVEMLKVNSKLLNKFREVASIKLADKEYVLDMLKLIDTKISTTEKAITDFSDRDFIAGVTESVNGT